MSALPFLHAFKLAGLVEIKPLAYRRPRDVAFGGQGEALVDEQNVDREEQVSVLAAALAEAGWRQGPEALLDLVDGVNASPLLQADTSWTLLFGTTVDDELRDALAAFRARRRMAVQDQLRADEMASAARLAALRSLLQAEGFAGFVLPRADEHQGEFLPRRAERLAWLTGFDGSAGTAVILATRAAIFVDGRYTLQLREQVDPVLYETRHISRDPPALWIRDFLAPGARLAYDPWLHTVDAVTTLRGATESAGGTLVALDSNPVDRLWSSQPPPPLAPVVPHDIAHAGVSVADKRLAIAETLAADGDDVVVLSSPESIAWLLNIRGADVPCTPLPLSFAILDRDAGVALFIDERKLTAAARAHLGNAVILHPRAGLGPALDSHARADRRIRVDPASTPAWILQRIEMAGGRATSGADPVVLPRACKNPVELAGARTAHERDGLAMVRFLHWFAGQSPSGRLDEMAAAAQLLEFRAEGRSFRGPSFETISGSGPNGAIVHYRVTRDSNRVIRSGDLYLVDSGAQYLDGTTDITRTIAVGDPGDEARDRFTRVLQGHIAIAAARFPVGTAGAQLDALARAPLWQAGLDFDHGTGHGVGSYLGVHEGPHGISSARGTVPLRPGMIVSNEPGYYKEGAYGIRLENLLIVREDAVPDDERPMQAFETLTLAPFDRSMVLVALLSDVERRWLDEYHARVRNTLVSLLEPDVARWLIEATAEIG